MIRTQLILISILFAVNLKALNNKINLPSNVKLNEIPAFDLYELELTNTRSYVNKIGKVKSKKLRKKEKEILEWIEKNNYEILTARYWIHEDLWGNKKSVMSYALIREKGIHKNYKSIFKYGPKKIKRNFSGIGHTKQ